MTRTWITTTLLGLLFVGVGLYFDYLELATPPVSDRNVVVFTAIALLGAIMINPDPIVGGLKQVIVVVLPIVPWAKRDKDGGDK
jgi:hypothetical protein